MSLRAKRINLFIYNELRLLRHFVPRNDNLDTSIIWDALKIFMNSNSKFQGIVALITLDTSNFSCWA